MKITRRQLKQIIQDAVMRQAIAIPRTRGQNDRKGFSSGIYEEDAVEEEESADLTLTEIRREIRSVIQEQTSGWAALIGPSGQEFEGNEGNWKYKLVDDDENNKTLNDLLAQSADANLGELEMVVSSARGSGFKFKLKDIKAGDWMDHSLTRQVMAAIAELGVDWSTVGSVAEIVDALIWSNPPPDVQGHITPEEFENNLGGEYDAMDISYSEHSVGIAAIAYIDFKVNSEWEGKVSIITGEPSIEINNGQVIVTIPSEEGAALMLAEDLVNSISGWGPGPGKPIIEVGTPTTSSDLDAVIILTLSNELTVKETHAEIKNFVAIGDVGASFDIVVYDLTRRSDEADLDDGAV
mgnify:CR=1 FL=1